jgi:hypothetical protein
VRGIVCSESKGANCEPPRARFKRGVRPGDHRIRVSDTPSGELGWGGWFAAPRPEQALDDRNPAFASDDLV